LPLRIWAVSQSSTVPSLLPEASSLPSGQKARLCTQVMCPRKGFNAFPLHRSHRRTDPLEPSKASNLPSGERATDLASEYFARNRSNSLPVATSHKERKGEFAYMYSLRLPLWLTITTSTLPSGEKARPLKASTPDIPRSFCDPSASMSICGLPEGSDHSRI